MACRRGIDGFARGPCIGQQERPVHGQPLGRGDGERIAVIEADIAVPVADLIVTERYGTPILGTRRYQDTRLRTGLAPLNLEVVDRDHGAVEQLLLPVGGANAQPVAARNLQRRGCPFVFRAPAYDHRHPVRIASSLHPPGRRNGVPASDATVPAPRPVCAPAPRWTCRGSPAGSGPSHQPDRSASFLRRIRYGTGPLRGEPRWPMPRRRRAAPPTRQPATA